jgi:hypothetical protein
LVDEPGASQPVDAPPGTVAALVFVPGISRSWSGQSLGELAEDITVSLDNASAGVRYSYAAAPAFDYRVGTEPGTARVVTISRAPKNDQGESVAALDLIELQYIRSLADQQERKSLVERVALVLMALVRGSIRLFGIFMPSKKSKTLPEKVQIILGAFVLFLYAFLLAVLVVELAVITLDAFRNAAETLGSAAPGAAISPTPSPTPTPPAGGAATPSNDGGPVAAVGDAFSWVWNSTGGRVIGFLPLLGAVLWMWLPPRARIKQAIINSATDYLAVDYYLRAGLGAPRLAGDVDGLLDAIRDDPRYRRIDVAAYSFGSIVAFNALFPVGNPPLKTGPIPGLTTLVTIGCPFDTVRLARADYFKDRKWPDAATQLRWVNVYTTNDILGSNFRDDDELAPPDEAFTKATEVRQPGAPAAASTQPRTVVPENRPYFPGGVPAARGVFDILALNGFKAHTRYWGSEPGENTCWTLVTQDLYRDDPILAPNATPATQSNGVRGEVAGGDPAAPNT